MSSKILRPGQLSWKVWWHLSLVLTTVGAAPGAERAHLWRCYHPKQYPLSCSGQRANGHSTDRTQCVYNYEKSHPPQWLNESDKFVVHEVRIELNKLSAHPLQNCFKDLLFLSVCVWSLKRQETCRNIWFFKPLSIIGDYNNYPYFYNLNAFKWQRYTTVKIGFGVELNLLSKLGFFFSSSPSSCSFTPSLYLPPHTGTSQVLLGRAAVWTQPDREWCPGTWRFVPGCWPGWNEAGAAEIH